jgi:hypothetical protein
MRNFRRIILKDDFTKVLLLAMEGKIIIMIIVLNKVPVLKMI